MIPKKVSAAGIKDIEQREGRKLIAYRDSRGNWTIGVGHCGLVSGKPIYAGLEITEAQCDALLAADLVPIEKAISKLVLVPLSDNEFDAVASWLFNVGVGDLKRSTILREINLGDMTAAAKAFDLYHKPPEIIGRRNGEKVQFLAGADKQTTLVRAGVLTHAAADNKTSAKAHTVGAVAVAVAGAATTALLAHHHATAGLMSGLSVLGTAAQAVFAWFHARKAKVLATNAAAQSNLAVGG